MATKRSFLWYVPFPMGTPDPSNIGSSTKDASILRLGRCLEKVQLSKNTEAPEDLVVEALRL